VDKRPATSAEAHGSAWDDSMLEGIKKAVWYAIILGFFITGYTMFGKPLWEAWVKNMGGTIGFFETSGGYIIAILGGLFARAIIWRRMGKA